MSRSKKRTLDELNDLKRTIKERDATIKKLERELKKLNQEIDPPSKKQATKKEEIKEEPSSPDLKKCPACGKNSLKTVDLGIRQIISCSADCNHRIVVKRG